MKNTKQAKVHGSPSGVSGCSKTHRWIMAIIFVGFVVVGLRMTKLRLTTSNRERLKTSISLVIFNQPMELVTIEKVHVGGHR